MSVNDIKNTALYQELGLQNNAPVKKSNELGQEEFLDLMVAQLRNQDPFKPLENGDFIAQMAQFSAVTGLSDLKTSFNQLASSLQSNQALQASTLVGRSVLVPTAYAPLQPGQGIHGVVEVPQSTMNLTVSIQDLNGELVRRIHLGGRESGDAEFSWDGLDQDGNPMPAGQYQIVAEVQGENDSYRAATFVNAAVESVLLGNAGQGIVLNLKDMGSVSFSEVREIS